uniref:Uncharacterized protein n=1 Tax=Anguilla anguilla TaxID=7936 RepID=A0A0E9WHR2_ANGAN
MVLISLPSKDPSTPRGYL